MENNFRTELDIALYTEQSFMWVNKNFITLQNQNSTFYVQYRFLLINLRLVSYNVQSLFTILKNNSNIKWTSILPCRIQYLSNTFDLKKKHNIISCSSSWFY